MVLRSGSWVPHTAEVWETTRAWGKANDLECRTVVAGPNLKRHECLTQKLQLRSTWAGKAGRTLEEEHPTVRCGERTAGGQIKDGSSVLGSGVRRERTYMEFAKPWVQFPVLGQTPREHRWVGGEMR